MDVTEEDLQNLYTWVRFGNSSEAAEGGQRGSPCLCTTVLYCSHSQVDEIPLSRPKRNIARDFADGGEA
jgi:hypothetical protein